MSKKEMFRALESYYSSVLDRAALDINSLLEKEGSESLDLLIKSVEKYANTLNQFNFCQKLKENITNSDEGTEKDEG